MTNKYTILLLLGLAGFTDAIKLSSSELAVPPSKAPPVGIEANSNGTEAEGPECRNCNGGGGWGKKMGMNSWTPSANKWDNNDDWNCPECDFIPTDVDICDWKPDIEDCDLDTICDDLGQTLPGQGEETETSSKTVNLG
jgi:hypothetical protein